MFSPEMRYLRCCAFQKSPARQQLADCQYNPYTLVTSQTQEGSRYLVIHTRSVKSSLFFFFLVIIKSFLG